MEQSQLETIANLAQELLNQLSITGTVSVSEKDDAAHVQIESEEAGVLIGFHGKNLESMQIMLGQMAFKQFGQWVRIVVSVGDYIDRRNEQLKEMALTHAARVAEDKQPVILSDLSPSERRIVHMALADHPSVVSESEGEGKYRKLVIKAKDAATA